MNFSTEIHGGTLEFLESEHIYLYDGIALPSVTQILSSRFPNKYADVPPYILARAARKGTIVHEAIERYYTTGDMTDIPELHGIIKLQSQYGFEIVGTEVPLVLFRMEEPVAAGRCDMVMMMDVLCGGDIKRTQTLDIEYLTAQLNLYRIAYRQCYRREWKALKGIHLRDDVHEMVDIPIDEALAWAIIEQYLEV